MIKQPAQTAMAMRELACVIREAFTEAQSGVGEAWSSLLDMLMMQDESIFGSRTLVDVLPSIVRSLLARWVVVQRF
jgi:hypothetical protein